MVAAMVTLGVVYAGGGRQAIDRTGFRAAVFAGVGRLLCPFVEFVFPSDGAVGVARTQSRSRQLTDALKRSAAIGAIACGDAHLLCMVCFG